VSEVDFEVYAFRVLTALAADDLHARVFWQIAPDPRWVDFHIDVTDVFAWGPLDTQRIDPSQLDLLERTVTEVRHLAPTGLGYAPVLFVCRVRDQRPQAEAYPVEKELWALVDAAGPDRGDNSALRPGACRPRERHLRRLPSPPTWSQLASAERSVVGTARVPGIRGPGVCHGPGSGGQLFGPGQCEVCGTPLPLRTMHGGDAA
jgi:hypothetical protein